MSKLSMNKPTTSRSGFLHTSDFVRFYKTPRSYERGFVVIKINRISEIFKDIAQVSLASIVIPYILDRSNFRILAIGAITTLLSWYFSVKLVRRI